MIKEIWVLIALMLPSGSNFPTKVEREFLTKQACIEALEALKEGIKEPYNGGACIRTDKVDAY